MWALMSTLCLSSAPQGWTKSRGPETMPGEGAPSVPEGV